VIGLWNALVYNLCPLMGFCLLGTQRSPHQLFRQGFDRRCDWLEDGAWEGTYTKLTGGILTVWSELGEPINKVATWAMKVTERKTGVVACRKNGRDYWETEQGLCETLVWVEEGWWCCYRSQ
jgi:hypothetical protein